MSVEEHLWLPSKRGAPGWLIGIILDHQQQHSALCLFDAGNLSKGPRSRSELPHIIPLGLYGCFVWGMRPLTLNMWVHKFPRLPDGGQKMKNKVPQLER